MKDVQNLPNIGKKLGLVDADDAGRRNMDSAIRLTPIPSRLVNSLLHVCDEIDAAIFLPVKENDCFTDSAKSLSAFSRITSSDLISRWESGLEALSENYLLGKFTPREFEKILNPLLVGVEKLEILREQLDGDVRSELRTCGEDAVLALENLREAVEDRCRILEKAFVDLGKKLEKIA